MTEPLDLEASPSPPPDTRPKLDPPGQISAADVKALFAWLARHQVTRYGHDYADVWASNLRDFTKEDLRWLAEDARRRGYLLHLEASLCALHRHRTPPELLSPSRSPGPPAPTESGAPTTGESGCT